MEGDLANTLPPRERPPANIAQPLAQAAREAERAAAEREEAARMDEARVLAEAYDRPPQDAYEPRLPQRNARASDAVREAHSAEWGGMSLGDTLLPKRSEKRDGTASGNGGGEYDERSPDARRHNGSSGDFGRSGFGAVSDYDRRGGGVPDRGNHDRRGGGMDADDYGPPPNSDSLPAWRGDGQGGNLFERRDHDRNAGAGVDHRASNGGLQDTWPPPRKAAARGPEGFGSSMESRDDDFEDFGVQVKVPARGPPGQPGGIPRSPESRSRVDMQDEMTPSASRQQPSSWSSEPPKPARTRKSAAPPADDGWGGQSLADAFAPKKASPPPGGGGGSSGSRGAPQSRGGGGGPAGGAGGGGAGADCKKKPEEIIAWVRSLPESHVPERSRENIAAIVEDDRLAGPEFTAYVQRVPPEICAPKHAMKLKAAWNNVLAEAAATEVARYNAQNQPTQKATMIVV